MTFKGILDLVKDSHLLIWKSKSLKYLVFFSVLLITFGFRGTGHAGIKQSGNDSIGYKNSDIREIEVFTGQQLFVLSLKPLKNKKKANFKAALRDAFMIVRYDSDSTAVKTEWLMPSKYGVYKMGRYNEGEPGYHKLDSLITEICVNKPKHK
ncbi:hypothetical protein [Pedobacter psychrodurus]|uniref:hypothetical protein n=1 Tax=Pedobacter psychrodurus TaxID=2530456 RepID=UPI002930C844|nr:hypothetical protein [Pedobacter psychrodurus]